MLSELSEGCFENESSIERRKTRRLRGSVGRLCRGHEFGWGNGDDLG